MGLLDKLWDDTVAGPRPETGLGRLRKHNSFGVRPDAVKDEAAAAAEGAMGRLRLDEAPKVTRSIMIKRPSGCPSPAGTPPPLSPFSGGRFRRKSLSDAYERGRNGPKSPAPPFEA
ncbi:dormancy-associated protein homolog 3-like isoform X2 [Ananas comosus]|uniref:Dormancy-associated protein homolog 3-like isoform X2 n=1 Tax=Ananas comosus TaxID=4615 RepID=A0A6P5F1E2_ANACO|nr:dormancy-associated protein homolog 3-like isoform X2 [Ananas comosus]